MVMESLKKALSEKNSGFDLVFFLRPGVVQKDQESVYNELVAVFSKL